MGYDGLGGDDVMRVLADVRRAYDVDPDRIKPHRSIDGRGRDLGKSACATPSCLPRIAPVCGVTDLPQVVAVDPA